MVAQLNINTRYCNALPKIREINKKLLKISDYLVDTNCVFAHEIPKLKNSENYFNHCLRDTKFTPGSILERALDRFFSALHRLHMFSDDSSENSIKDLKDLFKVDTLPTIPQDFTEIPISNAFKNMLYSLHEFVTILDDDIAEFGEEFINNTKNRLRDHITNFQFLNAIMYEIDKLLEEELTKPYYSSETNAPNAFKKLKQSMYRYYEASYVCVINSCRSSYFTYLEWYLFKKLGDLSVDINQLESKNRWLVLIIKTYGVLHSKKRLIICLLVFVILVTVFFLTNNTERISTKELIRARNQAECIKLFYSLFLPINPY